MDIGLKNSEKIQNFHYIRYDPLRPTEELTHPYGQNMQAYLSRISGSA